jgi:hypothetical protein
MSHATRLAEALSYAAAPTFAILATLNAGHESGGMVVLCPAGASFSGMTLMYLLMSAFHLAPWLKLIARRRTRGHQSGAFTGG